MKFFWIYAAASLFCLGLLLAGCNSTSPGVVPTEQISITTVQVVENATPYAAPLAAEQVTPQAYPELDTSSTSQGSYDFPEPVAGTATIRGKLVPVDPIYILPKGEDSLYLVPMPEGNVVNIPEFTVGDVPQAVVDEETGDFVFTNIPVGQYAIVVITTTEMQAPTRYMGGTDLVIITIGEEDIDKTKDVGTIQIP